MTTSKFGVGFQDTWGHTHILGYCEDKGQAEQIAQANDWTVEMVPLLTVENTQKVDTLYLWWSIRLDTKVETTEEEIRSDYLYEHPGVQVWTSYGSDYGWHGASDRGIIAQGVDFEKVRKVHQRMVDEYRSKPWVIQHIPYQTVFS